MRLQQKELWSAAKLAVRAYAKNPSERNAVEVEIAWERIRQYNSLAIWRQMKSQWLDQGTVPQYGKFLTGQAQDEKNANDQDLLTGT